VLLPSVHYRQTPGGYVVLAAMSRAARLPDRAAPSMYPLRRSVCSPARTTLLLSAASVSFSGTQQLSIWPGA
jgi:hypothetical protein